MDSLNLQKYAHQTHSCYAVLDIREYGVTTVNKDRLNFIYGSGSVYRGKFIQIYATDFTAHSQDVSQPVFNGKWLKLADKIEG